MDNVVDLAKFKSKKSSKKNPKKTVKAHGGFANETVEQFHRSDVQALVDKMGITQDAAKTWVSSLTSFAESVSDAMLRSSEKSGFDIRFAGLALTAMATMISDELFMMGMIESFPVEQFNTLKKNITEIVSAPLHVIELEETMGNIPPAPQNTSEGEDNGFDINPFR